MSGPSVKTSEPRAAAKAPTRRCADLDLRSRGAAERVLDLQAAAGNRAVARLLSGEAGRPLPARARVQMETRFGYDFGDVRVHDGPLASDAAGALDAKAFTVGRHIAFNRGRYAPASSRGQRLLAHELAHVVQQSRGGAAPSDRQGALETSAHAAADAAVGAAPGTVAVAGSSGVGVACEKDDDLLRRSKRTADKEQSFGDAAFDAILHDLKHSPLGHDLEASKRRGPAQLREDTTRSRARVDAAAHAGARSRPPPGRVPGAQIQHQTKTLDVTRNLPAGMNPLHPDVINENLMWLQSRKNRPSTLLHVDPKGGGTRFHVDDVPRGRVGDAGARGEQLDLFKPSAGPKAPDYNTEHKFMDNYLIPQVAQQIAESRRKAGLPPLDPRMLSIAAGEQARWQMQGESGSSRSGRVVDVAGAASKRPAAPAPATPPPAKSPQLELPFNAPRAPESAPHAPANPPHVSENTPHTPGAAPHVTENAPHAPGAPASKDSAAGPILATIAEHLPVLRGVASIPEGAPGTHEGALLPSKSPAPTETPAVKPQGEVKPETPPGGEKQGGGHDVLGTGTAAAQEGAALIRMYDNYQDARDKKQGVVSSAFSAAKTYLENTNIVAGTIANYRGKRADGQDVGDALLSTAGETVGGFLVPGKGVDQAINAAANLGDAVDDHLKRGDAKAQASNKANWRTAGDFAAELTPSKMFSETIGAGARAYWDVAKAATGDTKGVDKFGEDATRGKLGMVLQPWAMAADFAGNLGSGEGASKALDKTLKKGENSTLGKAGNATGDALYELGQSENAKAGHYGSVAQGWSMILGATSDHIAGKSWDQALERAAEPGKDTLLAKIGGAGGDLAWSAHEKFTEVTDQDIPAMKTAAQEKYAEVKSAAMEMKTEINDKIQDIKSSVADKIEEREQQAKDLWKRVKPW